MAFRPEDWPRAREVFEAAVALASTERPSYVARACEGNESLRAEVERLLASYDQAHRFLEAPAVARPAGIGTRRLEGRRLGPYQISSRIGAGGMGEVYKSIDTRLDRIVAVKVLPPHVASDSEARERFEREARAVAALNHPHICTLHDIGRQDPSSDSGPFDYLVMEYLDGETLAARLTRGPLPLAQALQYAVQMASALDKAHRAGIVHRDLKPGNMMLTKAGAKLLDFGLAQAGAPVGVGSSARLLSETALTTPGTILGTVQYMAPEQIEGKQTDARTDIFAFGAVLFEMLAGRQAFKADSQAGVIAAILDRDPPRISSLQPHAPPALDHVLKRCFAKDPDDRWQSARDVMLELESLDEREATDKAARSDGDTDWRKRLGWVAGVLAIGAVAGAAIATRARMQPTAAKQTPAHFVVPPSSSERVASLDFPAVAISPDGTLIAYVAARGGQTELFLRPIDAVEAHAIAGTRNATTPFFSPDSRWIAFFADGQLKKVSTSGGAPITLCDAPVGLGGHWGPADSIVFSAATGSGLSQVSANGGRPQSVTRLDASKEEFSHRWPEWLPDGKTVVYTIGTVGSWDDAQIVAQSLASGERRLLVQGGTNPHYLPSGHLIYAHRGAILAVPFDPARPGATSVPVKLLDNVVQSFDGAAQLSVSASGTGVYIAGEFTSNQRRLVTVDRVGVATPLAAPPGAYVTPRLSPDGRKLLVTMEAQTSDVWLHDITAGTLSQVTFDAGAVFPVWTPDGQRATFSSNKEGALNLFWTQIFQRGPAERLASSQNVQVPGSWSRDGRMLAFVEHESRNGRDVWLMTLDGDRARRPFLNSPFDESAPRFSPDGRWIAYVSNESGRTEVYLRSVDDPARKQPVSNNGGTEPVWARGGRELFYREGDRMMAVSLAASGADLRAAGPHALFQGEFAKWTIDAANYDVMPDDQHFLMVRAEEQASAQASLHVLMNWFDAIAPALSVPPR